MNVFYQLIGLGALAAMALSFYQKGKRQIMLWQMAAFACFILHYGLIGALSGSLCNVVQIISMLLFAARDRFHWPVLAAAIPIFLCYGVLGWYSYESPLALLPVIASGGAGTLDHLAEVLDAGHADAVLAASIFHFGTYTIPEAKRFLKERGIPVREPSTF